MALGVRTRTGPTARQAAWENDFVNNGREHVRRPFIAGNWKMNLSRAESVALASTLADLVSAGDYPADLAICPPAVYLDAVVGAVRGSTIAVGAQNMYHEPAGAFTGEISGAMLKDIGCSYVILGHSERRNVLGESSDDVNRKLRAALDAGLNPIVCVGELLEQREAGKTRQVIEEQFSGSFAGLNGAELARVVIAYEPVWAIGTGKVATPDQAEEVHLDLRRIMDNRYNSEVAQAVRIQYGGSVNPDNAAELLAQPNIDGALVGGASLQAESFLAIAEAAKVAV
jgi:triosephosphate isomerase